MIKCKFLKGFYYMQLKPIRKKETLYPTIKEVPESCCLKKLLLFATFTPTGISDEIYSIAIPSYTPSDVVSVSYSVTIIICKLIRFIFAVITIFSIIFQFKNRMKVNKCITENEVVEKQKKLKKDEKIRWLFLVMSMTIIIISSIIIIYLEDHI